VSDTHDPLDDAGTDLGGLVRSGITAAAEVTRAAAARQAQRDHEARRVADDEHRGLLERTRAEHHAAALVYGRVGHDRWWDHAPADQVAAAWTAAQGWETRDPQAGVALDEIRRHLAARPELRHQLADQYGLAFDHDDQGRLDHRARPSAEEFFAAELADVAAAETETVDHERQAAEELLAVDSDPPAAVRSPAEAAASLAEHPGFAPRVDERGRELAEQHPPGSLAERAAAAEVADLVDASFPMGSNRPLAGPAHDPGRTGAANRRVVARQIAAEAARAGSDNRAVGR
jgi:hypothetical protein